MSILIKGMEMPASCWDCFACHDGWCIINQKIEGHRTVTHSCPLVAVPDHGRLIDADDVYIALTEYYHHRTAFQHMALEEAIERVPTIILADKE